MSFINDTLEELTAKPTVAWQTTSAKRVRRNLMYGLHGSIGLLIILFNGLLLLTLKRRIKIRSHVSFMMLQLFIFCFIHGWVVGLIYPLHRVFRYQMSAGVCVFTTLTMEFMDLYILILLPLLAIERLVNVLNPNLTRSKNRRWGAIVIAIAIPVTMLYAWLPHVPHLGLEKAGHRTGVDAADQRYLNRFYKAYSCQYHLNIFNHLSPILIIVAECSCIIIVAVCFFTMYCIARRSTSAYQKLDAVGQKNIRWNSIRIIIISIIFLICVLPFGIAWNVKNMCESDFFIDEKLCADISVDLRFALSLVAHLSNLLAPMLLVLSSSTLRAGAKSIILCKGDITPPIRPNQNQGVVAMNMKTDQIVMVTEKESNQ